ncbi:MAG: DUF4126 domain-containing protein [Actinomycetota bacterium]
MDVAVGLIAGTGWASGLNLYLVAVLLGLAARVGVDDVPAALGHPAVLAVAVVLLLVEFVADKVAWLDSAWDAVHTVVRPAGATLLGSLLSDGDLRAAAAAGVLALLAHAGKAGLRLLANLSPEPLSNVALSVAEDGLAGVTVVLALLAPALALAFVAVLLAGSVVALLRLARRRREGGAGDTPGRGR